MMSKPNLKQTKSLELNVKILKFAGLWPWQEGKTGWRYHVRYYYPRVTICSASILLLLQVIDALNSGGNIEQLSENIYLSLIIVMALIKNGTMLYRMSDVEKLVKNIQNINQFEHYKDKEQLLIINYYQRYAQLLTKGFLLMALMTAINFSLGPLTKHGAIFPMPHRSWYPYDHTESGYYELSYFWLGITAMSDGMLIGVCDTLFVSMLITAIGHFKLLQHKMENVREYAVLKVMEMGNVDGGEGKMDRMENLNIFKHETQRPFFSGRFQAKNRDEEAGESLLNEGPMGHRFVQGYRSERNGMDGRTDQENKRNYFNAGPRARKYKTFDNEVNNEMELYVANLVEHHRHIMSVVEEVESVFSFVLIYQFVASLTIFCMVAFQTTKSSHIDAKLVALLQLLASAITELFMFCWFSSTLTDESSKVNEAFYLCDWMNSSPSFKKSMQIILLRINQPVCLNAAGFVHVSLDLFRSVVKTSYSFYTLLNQLDTPEHHHHMDEVHQAEALHHRVL